MELWREGEKHLPSPWQLLAHWSEQNNSTAQGSLLTTEDSIKLHHAEINARGNEHTHTNSDSVLPRGVKRACSSQCLCVCICVCAKVSLCTDQMCGPLSKLHLTAGIFLSSKKSRVNTGLRCALCNLTPLVATSCTLAGGNDGEQVKLLKGQHQ